MGEPKGSFETRKVIVCTGAWSHSFLPDLKLPLRPEGIAVCYWKEKTPGIYSQANGFPNVSHTSTVPIYFVPAFEYPGLVKGAYHGGPLINPETRNIADQDKYIQFVKEYIEKHFPGLDASKPAIVENCMYTVTPDGLPIVDYHPKYSNVVIGAGFCGGGYKVSAEIGNILAHLALDRVEELDYDMEKLSIERFNTKSNL